MKLHKIIPAAALAIVTAAGISAAKADTVGTSVSGSITFGGGGTNYFDPSNGFVPAGYLNTAGPTVSISASLPEFGFQDNANTDTADFTGTTLTVTDACVANSIDWEMIFTDSAFTSLNKTTDSFPGGVTATFSNNTITLDWNGTNTPGTFTATFDVGSGTTNPAPTSSVPIPAAAWSGGLVLGAMGLISKLAKRVRTA